MKKKEKKQLGGSPPQQFVGCVWIPNCSSLSGAHPHPSFPQCKVLGESRGVCLRGRGGGGQRRGVGLHPLRLTSANHQSRCWWRFRLRTERTSAVNLEEGEQVMAFNSSACLGRRISQCGHRHSQRSVHSCVNSAVSPQCIQHRQQVEKCCVTRVAEPGLYGYCIVWGTGKQSDRHRLRNFGI